MRGHFRREGWLLTLTVGVLLASLVCSSCSPPAAPPRLIIDESVAGDFATLAAATWDSFMDEFAARGDCFGDVRLRAVRTLNSRAAYDPATATVTVRVPGTAALLQSARGPRVGAPRRVPMPGPRRVAAGFCGRPRAAGRYGLAAGR